MGGTLQTLALRPPITAENGIFRRKISHFPVAILPSSDDSVFSTSRLLRIGVNRQRFRSMRPKGQSNQVILEKGFTEFLSFYGLHSGVLCEDRLFKFQVDGPSYYGSNSNSFDAFSWTHALLDFAVTNFLPIALISGIILGLVNPTIGCLAHRYSLSKLSTFGIFVISGLMLRGKEIGAAIEAWPAGMLGLGSILFLTPILSRLILKIQLAPSEFVIGLAIFCCMPTTLSSGVTLTNLVGGNSALALAMTVISNLLGIIIVPFSLDKFVGAGAGVSIPTMQLLKSLVSTLLVPLILGKILREAFDGVAEYVDQNRQLFSMMNSTLLSLVPWIQVSKSRLIFFTVTPTALAIAISTGILLHLVLLAFNTLAIQLLSALSGGKESAFAKKENSRAVTIVASQKTLPVMVAVVEQLGGAFGEPGLLVLPCVAAHINQIIIDSFLVNIWLQKDRLSAKTEETGVVK